MKNNLDLRILNENRTQLNEWVWFIPAIAGAIAAIGGGTIYSQKQSLSGEKQKMITTDKGFFVPEMYIGENFSITYFQGNEEPYELMDLDNLERKTGWKSYSDDYGTYLKVVGSSLEGNTDLRVYLPKKEWFDQFKGSIRTITDNSGVGSTKSNRYSLCFYLKNPKNAIKSKIVRPDGSEFFGPPQNMYDPETKQYVDEPSRGWAVLETFKRSGYFSMEGNVNKDLVESVNNSDIISEVGLSGEGGYDDYYGSQEYVDNAERSMEQSRYQKRINSLNEKLLGLVQNPPSGLQEYTWDNYSEDYGRSEFDRWYDSSSGTWIVIGTQICAAIALAPVAEAAAAAVPATLGTAGARIAYFSITIGGEAIFGIPEALYLHERGLTSQAALIVFCCLLPLFSESLMFGKIIGKPPGFDDQISKMVQEYRSGSFKSPADFKKWMKGLEPSFQKQLQQQITICADYYSKAGTKNIQKQIIDAMAKSLDEIKSSGIKGDKDLLTKWDYFRVNYNLVDNPSVKKYIKGRQGLVELEKQAKQLGELTKGKHILGKSLGLNLLAIGGVIFPICMFAFKDNEEFIKDPQGILNGSEYAIASLTLMSSKNSLALQTKIQNLTNEIKTLSEAGKVDEAFAKSKEFTQLLVDLNFINSTTDWGTKKKYHSFIEDYKYKTLNDLQNEYYKGISEGNKEKVKTSLENARKIDTKHANQWWYWALAGSPYKKMANGYIDESGKKYAITNEELISFFEWFCGFNMRSKTLTNSNSYQSSNNISYTASFTFENSQKVKKTSSWSFNNQNLLNQLKIYSSREDIPLDYENTMSEYYWGNIYFIQKAFTDYYDDYLVSKKTNTTNKQ